MQTLTQIQRQWQILIALNSRQQGLTVVEIATEVGVDTRTIRRDLHAIRAAGFPLVGRVSRQNLKHWTLGNGDSVVPLSFNWSEAVALYLGRRLLDPLAGTNFWHSAHSAFLKIRAVLGESALEHLDQISSAFLQTTPGVSNYSEKADLIDRLMQAIEEHLMVDVAYQRDPAADPAKLVLPPYEIVYHKGSLYLMAFSPEHQMVRIYKLDRVVAVELQKQHYEPDPQFDLQRHLAHSFGVFRSDGDDQSLQSVRIRFSPEVARYVREKTWHSSQHLSSEPDGSLLFEVELDNTRELKTWIQSFGPTAMVLQPASLRQEIIQDAVGVLKRYGALIEPIESGHPKQATKQPTSKRGE